MFYQMFCWHVLVGAWLMAVSSWLSACSCHFFLQNNLKIFEHCLEYSLEGARKVNVARHFYQQFYN